MKISEIQKNVIFDSVFDTVCICRNSDRWRVGLNFKNIFDVDYIAGASEPRERGSDRGESFTVIGSFSYEF